MARRRQYHGELKCREVFDIKIRKNVFYPTVLMILAFSGCYLFNDELVSKASDWMNQAFNQTLGWFYLVVALFLVIVTALALFSKFGKSRIGGSKADAVHVELVRGGIMYNNCGRADFLGGMRANLSFDGAAGVSGAEAGKP